MKFPGTQAFVNQLVVCTLVTCTAGGSVGLGAVWMQQRITMTAAANKTLERDLATFNSFGDAFGSSIGLVKAWQHNSAYRRNWALRTLHAAVLSANAEATVAVLQGMAANSGEVRK